MKATISDPGTQLILESQLRQGDVTWLSLEPFRDIVVKDHQFAVYASTLEAESKVLDAWVVTAMGKSGFYNQDNYPTPDDAVRQHIGRLVVEGHLDIVEMTDGATTEDIPANDPPPGFETL